MKLKDKLSLLSTLDQRGFKMMKLFGVNPSPNLKVSHSDKKTGNNEQRLRCRCRAGQHGESCGSEGKHPIQRNKSGNHGFIPDYSHELAAQLKFCNWAILAGELLPNGQRLAVLDIDIHKGGFESLAECEQKYGTLPATFTQTTGTGGKHLFFSYPSDWVIESKANHPALGKGFDVKARWGYVVSAGSLHHQGRDYTLDNPDAEIQPLPEQWLNAIGKPESLLPEVAKPLTPEQIEAMASRFRELKGSHSGKGLDAWANAALDGECKAILAAPSGQGNAQQNLSAFRIGSIVGAGLLQYHDALGALLDAANARGGSSSGSKARKSIESGLSAGRRQPRLPKPKEQKHSDALDEWFKTGGKSRPIAEVITPEAFESLTYEASFWDLRAWYGINNDQIDKSFEATLAREHAFKQSDPKAFAKWEAAEIDRQGNLDFTGTPLKLSAAQQVDLWQRQNKRDNIQPSGLSKYNDGIHDCLKTDPITQKDVKHWHRCTECVAQLRPCEKCATEKLGAIRTYPGPNRCAKGHKQLLQPIAPDKQHLLKKIHHKCGWWGCHHCGFDNECDHLAHLATFGEFLLDSIDSPVLSVPSYHIENLSITHVAVQTGVWKVLVSDKHSRQYSNKLSKLKGEVYWLADYVGNATYAYYCILTPGVSPWQLRYRPGASSHGEADDNELEYTPEHISFRQFNEEHRQNLSNVGRYLSLTKSIWEMCDQPAGARARYNAVNYCRALKMPKRFISSGANRSLGTIVLTYEQELAVCEEFGIDIKDHDPNRIDKSYKRGLTQCLLNFGTYQFGKHTPEKVLQAFIARLLGKERIIEPMPLFPDTSQEAARALPEGSTCYRYSLIM